LKFYLKINELILLKMINGCCYAGILAQLNKGYCYSYQNNIVCNQQPENCGIYQKRKLQEARKKEEIRREQERLFVFLH